MFDGNVIYEMNPVGEINIPHEEKAPNMNDDGKGKISIATGGSGGGIRLFNIELIDDGEYIIHGATVNDLKSVVVLNGVFWRGEDPLTVPFAYYKDSDDMLYNIIPDKMFDPLYIDGEYLDGVRVHAEQGPG